MGLRTIYPIKKTLDELQEKKRASRRSFLLLAVMVYSFVAIYLVGFLMDGNSSLLSGGNTQKINLLNGKISKLDSKIIDLGNKFQDLKTLSDTDREGFSFSQMSSKIDSIEKKQESIEQTILYDAEKAITARLLRDQQNAIEEDIRRIETTQNSLSDKFYNLMITVVFVPLASVLLPSILSWIQRKFSANKSLA
jgi:outer membrane murein-binding lipoprotein Lpp